MDLVYLSRSLWWHYLLFSLAFPLQPMEIRIYPFPFQTSQLARAEQRPSRGAGLSLLTTSGAYCMMRALHHAGHGELLVSWTLGLKHQREPDGSK